MAGGGCGPGRDFAAAMEAWDRERADRAVTCLTAHLPHEVAFAVLRAAAWGGAVGEDFSRMVGLRPTPGHDAETPRPTAGRTWEVEWS